jgi:riboflavin synthase
MFSGIVADVGVVAHVDKQREDWTIQIRTSFNTAKIAIGDSIACDGICLTVTEISKNSFAVQASLATQTITNLTCWESGYQVNLEKALSVGDLLNGHFVQGHIDCTTKILAITKSGESHVLQLELSPKLKKYIAYKGSVTLNGVSLTVNAVTGSEFSVNIIPHTWENTNLSSLKVSSLVNIEVDLLARYLEKLLDSNIIQQLQI